MTIPDRGMRSVFFTTDSLRIYLFIHCSRPIYHVWICAFIPLDIVLTNCDSPHCE